MAADPRRARLKSPNVTNPPPPPPPPSEPVAEAPSTGLNGAADVAPQINGTSKEGSFKLRFCTVCASNNNRSMEGHLRLASAQYPVISFGTGSLVRLPGPSVNQPNVFSFNTVSYDDMYKDLESKDPRLYRVNGCLNMLGRNRTIKWGPERWQDWRVGEPRIHNTTDKGSHGSEGGVVDVVVTCEERCWDAVVDDLMNRASPLNRPVHVFNIDIRDNYEESLIGGKAILDLADSLNAAAIEEREAHGAAGWDEGAGASREGFDARVPEILGQWQERWPNLPALWTLGWF